MCVCCRSTRRIPYVIFTRWRSPMLLARRALVCGALLVVFGASLAVRAQAPDPMIGTWILNLAKSHYDPGTAPKSETRSFDFSQDGKILCTFHRVSAQGTRSFGHWL